MGVHASDARAHPGRSHRSFVHAWNPLTPVRMTRTTTIAIVRASGSPGSMGNSVGRKCADLARFMVQAAKISMKWKGVKWEEATARVSDYLPYAREYDPAYLEFVEGYASGALVYLSRVSSRSSAWGRGARALMSPSTGRRQPTGQSFPHTRRIGLPPTRSTSFSSAEGRKRTRLSSLSRSQGSNSLRASTRPEQASAATRCIRMTRGWASRRCSWRA